jgi:hypothetical protein
MVFIQVGKSGSSISPKRDGSMAGNRVIFVMMVGVMCAFLFCSDGNSQGNTDRWSYYGATEDGNQYYYDEISIIYVSPYVSPKVVKVWEKIKYSKTGKDAIVQMNKDNGLSIDGYDKLDNIVFLKEVECINNTYKIIKIVDYDGEGKILDDIDYPNPKTRQILPGSMGEKLFMKVCKK